jgi:hypothetical protein
LLCLHDQVSCLNATSHNYNRINELDIADGLKHIIISDGFTIEVLLNTSPTIIATTLEIDQFVANLIRNAATDK